MPKFIVRDRIGEFWTCLVRDTIEAANAHMIEVQARLSDMGEDLQYTIEPEPDAPMFKDSDWLDDWNNPASRHHY